MSADAVGLSAVALQEIKPSVSGAAACSIKTSFTAILLSHRGQGTQRKKYPDQTNPPPPRPFICTMLLFIPSLIYSSGYILDAFFLPVQDKSCQTHQTIFEITLELSKNLIFKLNSIVIRCLVRVEHASLVNSMPTKAVLTTAKDAYLFSFPVLRAREMAKRKNRVKLKVYNREEVWRCWWRMRAKNCVNTTCTSSFLLIYTSLIVPLTFIVRKTKTKPAGPGWPLYIYIAPTDQTCACCVHLHIGVC